MPDGRQANPPEPSALLGQKHPINQIESGRFYAPGRGDDNPIVSRGAASSMQSGSSQPSLQEQALLNHVKRLERAGGSHCAVQVRSEEHTSELQSLMSSSHAVFCWKKQNTKKTP